MSIEQNNIPPGFIEVAGSYVNPDRWRASPDKSGVTAFQTHMGLLKLAQMALESEGSSPEDQAKYQKQAGDAQIVLNMLKGIVPDIEERNRRYEEESNKRGRR